MGKTILINCTVLDGSRHMEPRRNMSVVLEGEQIQWLGEGTPDTEEEEVNVFDLQGHYLMPGMVNLKGCLARSGGAAGRPARKEKLSSGGMGNPVSRALVRIRSGENARVEMMSGVTTLVAVDSAGGVDSLVRDWINIAHVDGPRVLATNAMVLPRQSGEEETRAEMQMHLEGRPDILRADMTWGGARMSRERLETCCREAHAHGCRVMVRAETEEDVRTALECGTDIIEGGARLSESGWELFRERGAALMCSFSPLVPWAGKGGGAIQEDTKRLLEERAQCVSEAMARGIPVGLGSSAGEPFSTHYGMWREVYWFHRYGGVDTAMALHTATQVNAGIAGLGEATGAIEEGKCADFFVTDRNPLEDLTVLRSPTMVVTRGVVMIPRLFPDKRVERTLDKLL